MRIPFALLAALAIPLGVVSAQNPKAGEAAKPAEPPKAVEPETPTTIYAPTDLSTLKPLKGQKVTLEGTIDSVASNRSESIRYLNFTKNFRESVSLVFFVSAGNGTFTKEKLSEYVGKRIRITGLLSDYQENLQIKVTALDQLKVIEQPSN